MPVGDAHCHWFKCNQIKLIKGQQARWMKPLCARGFSHGFAACPGCLQAKQNISICCTQEKTSGTQGTLLSALTKIIEEVISYYIFTNFTISMAIKTFRGCVHWKYNGLYKWKYWILCNHSEFIRIYLNIENTTITAFITHKYYNFKCHQLITKQNSYGQTIW